MNSTQQKSNIMVIDGTELSKNPAKVMTDVQKFLNLEIIIDQENFYYDEKRGLFCFISPDKPPKCTGKGKGRSNNFQVEDVAKKVLREFFEPFNMELSYMLDRERFEWDF